MVTFLMIILPIILLGKLISDNLKSSELILKEKWIQALKSGNYKQGTGNLYNIRDNSYCCLGVLGSLCNISNTDLIHRSFIRNNYGDSQYDHSCPKDSDKLYPSAFKKDFTDLSKENLAFILSNMNDIEKKSFKEISDYIEKEIPESYFKI